MSAEARLKELGLVLPALQKPVANYLPYRLAGNLLFLAGQGPRDEKGAALTGKLGAEISIDEGYRRARLVGLGLLAAIRDALGSLDRVDFISNCLAWSTRCRISMTRQRSLTAALTYLSKCSVKRTRCPLRGRQRHAAKPDLGRDRGYRRGQGVSGALAEKLDLRRAEPDEVLWRHGNRPVDTEDRDLEFVSRLDRIR